MELNITELNNINTMNPYSMQNYETNNQTDYNYWESNKNKSNNQVKKKKVSFNDILSNMNLVVNKQGVLQYMGMNEESNTNREHQYQESYQDVYQDVYQQQYQSPLRNSQQPQYTVNKQSTEPLDHSVKHSYIYNKYFKDYVDPNINKQGPRVPKTIEEYHQMLLDDKIKEIEHKKRIEQIKSKKLLFTSVPGSQSNTRNIQASKNNLRMMNFR